MGETDSFIKQARVALDEINAGRGTLGKLSRDEALYTEATTMMRQLREIPRRSTRARAASASSSTTTPSSRTPS